MKRWKIICSLLLCMAIFLTSCSGIFKSDETGKTKGDKTHGEQSESKNEVQTKDNEESEVPAETGENNETDEINGNNGTQDEDPIDIDPSNLNTIADFINLWSKYEDANERYINEYTGFEMLALIAAGLCFATSVQYDILNLENKDGRFEGTLALMGASNAYIERNNKKLTFGYDYVLEEDRFVPYEKAGDRLTQEGECDLNEVYYFDENITYRNDAVIKRTTNEFRLEDDDSMSCIIFAGGTIDSDGNESKSSEALFLRNGMNRYDFVAAIAEDGIGVEFDQISLKDHPDLTREKAIELFTDAGYKIDFSGGIVDGKIVVEK